MCWFVHIYVQPSQGNRKRNFVTLYRQIERMILIKGEPKSRSRSGIYQGPIFQENNDTCVANGKLPMAFLVTRLNFNPNMDK